MKLFQNEKGVTLIEVLAAIVILAAILGSLMNFFPQMGLINKENGDKSQAISTAKQVLITWQNNDAVQAFLKGSQTAVLPVQPLDKPDNDYYYFKTTAGDFDVNIKIAKNSPANFPSGTSAVRFIKVQLQKQDKYITESYGYITLD